MRYPRRRGAGQLGRGCPLQVLYVAGGWPLLFLEWRQRGLYPPGSRRRVQLTQVAEHMTSNLISGSGMTGLSRQDRSLVRQLDGLERSKVISMARIEQQAQRVEKLRCQLRDLGVRQPLAFRLLVGRTRQLDEAVVEDLIARYRWGWASTKASP